MDGHDVMAFIGSTADAEDHNPATRRGKAARAGFLSSEWLAETPFDLGCRRLIRAGFTGLFRGSWSRAPIVICSSKILSSC
jgi:hypothetical protein